MEGNYLRKSEAWCYWRSFSTQTRINVFLYELYKIKVSIIMSVRMLLSLLDITFIPHSYWVEFVARTHPTWGFVPCCSFHLELPLSQDFFITWGLISSNVTFLMTHSVSILFSVAWHCLNTFIILLYIMSDISITSSGFLPPFSWWKSNPLFRTWHRALA
jgi:hypothetical protein